MQKSLSDMQTWMQPYDGANEDFVMQMSLQEDEYANVMHVMQMFEPILMDVQKFIAAFFVQKADYLVWSWILVIIIRNSSE